MNSIARPRIAGAILLAATALVAAGCGGDDATTDSATSAAATTAAPASTATDTAAAAGTIVDVAASNPDFSILVAAVQKAGLAETLSGSGPFTVFAPTNAAFEKTLADAGLTQDELLASPDLAAILTYHVLPGKVMAADITGALSPATVEGQPLAVTLDGSSVKVGPAATVQTADVAASNGVIHAIDAVLLPPGVTLGA